MPAKIINEYIKTIALLFTLLRVSETADYGRYYHRYWIPWRPLKERVYNPKPPRLLFDEYFSTRKSIDYVRNMSAELLKDVEIKLRYLAPIQLDYQDNKYYSAGTVAAGIMEKYGNLLSIYKFYSGKAYLRNKRFLEIMHAYQIMQSHYNEYRVERDLFLDIVNDRYVRPNTSASEEESLKNIKSIADWNKLSPAEQKKFIEKQKQMGWDDESGRRRLAGDKQDLKFNNIDEEIKTIRQLETEYKKNMRYNKWAQKRQGFDPDMEGIPVDERLVKQGLEKTGDFNAF